MTDIVERLRALHPNDLFLDAADEIERLQDIENRLGLAAITMQEEIERLRRVVNWLRRQANAERDPVKKAVFIESHNAALQIMKQEDGE